MFPLCDRRRAVVYKLPMWHYLIHSWSDSPHNISSSNVSLSLHSQSSRINNIASSNPDTSMCPNSSPTFDINFFCGNQRPLTPQSDQIKLGNMIKIQRRKTNVFETIPLPAAMNETELNGPLCPSWLETRHTMLSPCCWATSGDVAMVCRKVNICWLAERVDGKLARLVGWVVNRVTDLLTYWFSMCLKLTGWWAWWPGGDLLLDQHSTQVSNHEASRITHTHTHMQGHSKHVK